MLVEQLTNAAALQGAQGARTFLNEHHQSHRDLLHELATLTLVGDAVGMRMQLMPLAVQREVWSAFVKWQSTLPSDALHALAMRFVQRSKISNPPMDATCVWLAQLVIDSSQTDDDTYMEEYAMAKDADDTPDPLDGQLRRLAFLPTVEVATTNPNPQPRKRRRSADLGTSQLDTRGESNGIVERENDQAPPSPIKPTAVALPAETETRVVALAKQLVLVGAPDASADDSSKASELASLTVDLLRQVMNQVHATQQDNETLFRLACSKLQLALTSDDALFQVTSGLMEANWSSRYAGIYLDTTLLPRILKASSVISRVLVQTALLYAKPSYATALMDGLLVPLLVSPSIGPSQGEAVTRMLRENCVPTDQLDGFLRRVLETSKSFQAHGLLANEATVLVFQNVLNMKPVLMPSTVELLMSAARSALDHESTKSTLPKSAKFATLLFTLVSKFGPQCKPHIEELEAVASQLSSLMAKSTMRAIQKLKN